MLLFDVDPLLGHYLNSSGVETVFYQAGGTGMEKGGVKMTTKSFSHLTATGIAGAEKEYVG